MVSDGGLRNLLDVSAVRIVKVKAASCFPTLLPTLCRFSANLRVCGPLPIGHPKGAGFIFRCVHFLAGNLQVETEKLIPQ